MEGYKVLIMALMIILMMCGIALSDKRLTDKWLNYWKRIAAGAIFAAAVVGAWIVWE